MTPNLWATLWKRAAKFWYDQFLTWESAYNELADVYMIDESYSTTNAVTYFFTCNGRNR